MQLDEVLTTLQQPDRREPQRGCSRATARRLADPPTAAEDIGQDPDVQGKSGGRGAQPILHYGGDAGKSSSQVSQALLGEKPGDLSA